jgi:hypothetical protein
VVDRQGRPVAGAQVVAGGDDAATATDAMGNFRLTGLAPDHTLLVVRREGFASMAGCSDRRRETSSSCSPGSTSFHPGG